ncbi:uncharacterized protein ACR2FA_004372 [Aphomia sociella]
MEEKMESEQSMSGASSSSSESSSGSSDSDELLETVRILGQTLELPQELCEDYTVFKEFFSMKTWEALEDQHKEQLMKYLPKFPDNDEEEKEKTIEMLFNHEPFHFTSPFGDFYNNLKHGNYRPDIAKMRKFLKKARAKQQKHKIKSYYAKLLPEVLISRERLLAASKAAPPGPTPRLPLLPSKPSSKNNYKPLYLRARQRYFEELAAIRGEVGGDESDDENYPDGPPEQTTKKRKHVSGQNSDSNVSGTLGGSDSPHPTSLDCLKNILAAHRMRRMHRENHPELNTVGITLDDIKQRVALVNGAKKIMFGGQKPETPIQKLRRGSKKDKVKHDIKSIKRNKEEPQDNIDSRPLLPNIKIKCEQEESDSESSSFVDPVTSPKHSNKLLENIDIKQEVDVKYSNISNINYNELKLENIVKQEPQDPMMSVHGSKINQPVPIKLEDLDGIDMMALPVEIADDSGEVVAVDTTGEDTEEHLLDTDESLTEITHANFLSLVRALFPARAAHRASKQQLHARCAAVMRSPIAPLNTWYSLSDDWCAELDSALDFLAGERGPHPDDFVPYLQFIPETQMYQWIGAGRDCDALLGRLCERWLRAAPAPPAAPASVSAPASVPAAAPTSASAAVAEPPPSRYPTSWTVRPPTNAEIAEFRAQERRRFASAGKPFTYVQHGYKSVVGPVCRSSAEAAGVTSAAAILAVERPRGVTLVALLRDALARLPNGEGNRHHILTMLKMSQWIMPCSDQSLLSVVSSTLDKLQAVKRDPIVKYDQRTALWTYLYRHRNEEDWLKQGGARGRRSGGREAREGRGARGKSARPRGPPLFTGDLDIGTVEEVIENASDSDVDVEDSGGAAGAPQLSSAQLLMQAQASQGKLQTPPPSKSKGKLIATSPKTKLTVPPKQVPKQSNLMTQSVKQATLLSQVKQASLIQTSKQSSTPHSVKQVPSLVQSKQATLPTSTPKQTSLMAQSAKQASLIAQATKTHVAQALKQNVAKAATIIQSKQVNVAKQSAQSPKSTFGSQPVKPIVQLPVKQGVVVQSSSSTTQAIPVTKSILPVISTPHKSPLIKQRPLQKTDPTQPPSSTTGASQQTTSSIVIQPTVTVPALQTQNKLVQGTRSLLIRPPAVQTTVTAAVSASTQNAAAARRGVVRVLSPAAPSSGKSLISPRALMQQGTTIANKKRPSLPNAASVTTIAQSTASATVVVSSVPTVVTSSVPTRTVQLAGGRTVQLASNQTVHLPGGQSVQLSAGHTLQLSSLQLPAHSVRLPSGQTVQLASPPTVQTVRALSTTTTKNASPRSHQTSGTVKNIQTSQSTVQIPVSTVQLAGQTVQIAGQTVQLAGQSVQLTGHTVKLPSGQSVQVASQGVIPTQSVQLPSGQTVQLASGNMQTVQLGSNVQLSSGQSVQTPNAQSVQLGSQTVQLSGQTVQLAGGQTVQLPSGQTLQLSSGQTVQLSSGQTIQLASGQTVQLANQQTPKPITQVVRSQASGEKSTQPIVAKLLTNAQGQMISLEGVVGPRLQQLQQLQQLQLAGPRPRAAVRVLAPARPLLLAHKPLHNIILQQSDGSAIRVTSSGGAATSQTIVLSNIGAQAVTTSTTTTPVLKLQQVNPIQQVKLAQGIKIQGGSATVPTSSGVRSVLMDGQQLKLVGGRHVLARILRPAHPPQ